jgi:CRISPR/Cas system-associated exonuclease Cas4 (RecB family)
MASARARKHAPWSASKIGAAMRCPRFFHYRYEEKRPEPEVMPEARIGKAIHSALEKSLLGTPVAAATAEARAPLLSIREQKRYDTIATGIAPFIHRIDAFRTTRRVSRTLVEYRLAITEDFTPTQFYSGNAFFRGIIDVAYIWQTDTIALVDHKSGERHASLNIADQLRGYAVLAAMSFPNLRHFRLGVHWVGDQVVDWAPDVIELRDINARFLPELVANIEAAALTVDDGPRADPGAKCYRCSYRTICPEGQKVRYEPVDDDPDPGLDS